MGRGVGEGEAPASKLETNAVHGKRAQIKAKAQAGLDKHNAWCRENLPTHAGMFREWNIDGKTTWSSPVPYGLQGDRKDAAKAKDAAGVAKAEKAINDWCVANHLTTRY